MSISAVCAPTAFARLGYLENVLKTRVCLDDDVIFQFAL